MRQIFWLYTVHAVQVCRSTSGCLYSVFGCKLQLGELMLLWRQLGLGDVPIIMTIYIAIAAL